MHLHWEHPSTRNQDRWTKYGWWTETEGHLKPERAISGHFNTLRAYEAAHIEDRYWDDPDVRRIEKMVKLPERLEESNYGEWPYSFVKEDRWARTRRKVVETAEKHRKFRNRRRARLEREQQRQ